MTAVLVNLLEWQTESPDAGKQLAGMSLAGNPAAQKLANDLTSSGKIEVLELNRGLELRASSYVGRISFGGLLAVTVRPKIAGMPLLNLLRYAYGLRDLRLFGEVGYTSLWWSFQDLLIEQFRAEVSELLSRGLHRDYQPVRANLAIPRGRIDFNSYVKRANGTEVVLPCLYHPRSADMILNQVLLRGLGLASRLATDLELRLRLRRLARSFDLKVSPGRLDRSSMQEAWRMLDRRTGAYKPAFTLLDLLLQSQGISLEEDWGPLPFSGFLFDMNRFFQSLLSRFLHDYLEGYVIKDEYRLQEMLYYDPAHNPRARRSPQLRPDFVVLQGSQIAAVLDAKYRDLWEKPLPREMLYQLALYALSQTGTDRQAVILYPTLDPTAEEQVVVIQEPVQGAVKARVTLRPVDLFRLEKLLQEPSSQRLRRETSTLAHQFVFGI